MTCIHKRGWRRRPARPSASPFLRWLVFLVAAIYVGAITHWRPRQDWFRRECPKLAALAAELERLPALAALFRKHFS
jgi:hypothetical protein